MKQVKSGAAFKTLCIAAGALILQACASTPEVSEAQSQDAAQFNAQLGAQYLQRGELDQAREKLTKALEQDDENALAHVTFAQLQARIAEPDLALVHFKRALQLEPEEANHRNSYGIYLCEQDNFDEAKAQFRKAADNAFYRTPEFALDNAGVCMLDANRLNEAEEFLREALRINPQFARAYLNMADLMHRRDRLSVADAYYQRFATYGQESAQSLLLGVRLKSDAGQLKTAERFATRLLNKFPSSKEAGEYLARPIR